MNENMELVVALLVAFVVGIFTIVFTGSSDGALVAWWVSLTVTFLAVQTFKGDN